MSPEKVIKKPKTKIDQNFTITPEGKIIKNNQELPPRKGIIPFPKTPKKN